MSAATNAGAAAAAPACAHTACGKELQPPLLCCSRCKKEAYCSKACQVYLLLQLLHHHARAACGVCLGFGKV